MLYVIFFLFAYCPKVNKFYIALDLVALQTYAFIKKGIPETAYNARIPKEIHIYVLSSYTS